MRNVALGFGVAIVFALVALLMIGIMPSPLRQTDFMVIGAVATLVSMLVLFGILAATSMKTPDIFFKKRLKK